jgi:transcriptional regulator with XRE-family HTH domain
MPPIELAKTFGLNVRRERERQGLSVRALGHACGMDGAGISRVENAERDLRLSTVERVARGLDVAPADLLRDSK